MLNISAILGGVFRLANGLVNWEKFINWGQGEESREDIKSGKLAGFPSEFASLEIGVIPNSENSRSFDSRAGLYWRARSG